MPAYAALPSPSRPQFQPRRNASCAAQSSSGKSDPLPNLPYIHPADSRPCHSTLHCDTGSPFESPRASPPPCACRRWSEVAADPDAVQLYQAASVVGSEPEIALPLSRFDPDARSTRHPSATATRSFYLPQELSAPAHSALRLRGSDKAPSSRRSPASRVCGKSPESVPASFEKTPRCAESYYDRATPTWDL